MSVRTFTLFEDAMQILKFAVAVLAALSLQIITGVAEVRVKAPKSCGYHSGNFARTCSASSTTRCFAAAKRGVAGFTNAGCEKHRATCSSCLQKFHRCLKGIEHKACGPTKASSQSYAQKFGRCMRAS